MATPKFDRISVEFAQRISDPVTTAATAGNVLTADQRTSYVNKALHKLVNDVKTGLQGNLERFADIFPELVDNRVITLTAGSIYVLANPNLDFLGLIALTFTTNSVPAEILPASRYGVVAGAKIPQMAGTAAKPIIIELNKTLYAFPAASFVSAGATITIIKQPLNPTDGSFLTQGGTYDSPFYDTWNSKIAEIAEQLWRIDAGE